MSLRWRLALLSATLVAFAVGVITVAAYWSVSNYITTSIDRNLEDHADVMLERASAPGFYASAEAEIDVLSDYFQDVRIALKPPGWEYVVGESVALPRSDFFNQGGVGSEIISANSEKILIKRDHTGAIVILVKDMVMTEKQLTGLGVILLLIGGCGVLAAILLGFFIANEGLKPLARLQRAVEDIVRTDELRSIPVMGNDEFAKLTRSFNDMLKALRESRARQSQLVADAGHELKTPLTSMRTNIELLLMTSKNGNHSIPEEELDGLREDVLAQMSELSDLIGDLVDLAREESTEVSETVNLNQVLEIALSRIESRRLTVDLDVSEEVEWQLQGDDFSLTRALVNVLDNAIKWSPENGTVMVSIAQHNNETVRIVIEDSGPGIAEAERALVLERFYRSVNSRSMPGSGLGLAIVHQVVKRHGGELVVDESDDGGTRIIMDLPGEPIVSGFKNVAD
ncbi:HAMP domain-containing sensor histidine kinase [Corynebacterium crudilactis]|uniref:histidine kinase n=1 Tax=Corynebacterium crudilactis TaxID=1652495 RepID=A0A172QS52_9CORY|nr:two-component sensor histidine kinase [Corynebacterium crudilactis]